MNPLRKAADLEGCLDPDVLTLARSDLEPRAAVQDLKARFPGAFRKHVKDMTAAELKDLEYRLTRPQPPALPTAEEIGDVRNMSPEDFAKAKRKLGIVK